MRIGVIGAGVAGLTAAYLLEKDHDVCLWEARPRAGGHAHTVEVKMNGQFTPVDTGFLVYNERTYPRFTRLLQQLDVETESSEMSFSIQDVASGLEYNGHGLNELFAQRKNLFSYKFWKLLREILRFNRKARDFLADTNRHGSLGEFLDRHGFAEIFNEKYLIPMGAAIWSSPSQDIREIPARFFLSFFQNHGLLKIIDRPQWRTITGGSREYVRKLTSVLGDQLQLHCPIRRVRRKADGVVVETQAGKTSLWDAVIFAVHSDQILSILDQPRPVEQKIFSSMPYHKNRAVLHTDRSLLPVTRRAWASWNVYLDPNSPESLSVTYYVNRLQNLESTEPLCVTLNPVRPIDPEDVIDTFEYDHPAYSRSFLRAQQRLRKRKRNHRLYFIGAWRHNGFHEDGVRSARDAVRFIQQEVD